MTDTNALARQPTKLDYASPTQFKFSIIKLPKVEYFCTAVNVPGVSLGGLLTQATPLKHIPLPGDNLTYDNLTCTFLVDENLENYREMHSWLTGLGFPEDRKQYRDLAASGQDRFPGQSPEETDPGKVKYGAQAAGGTYSDATLNVLTSKNNPNIEVRFSDVWPLSLSGLSYDQGATDVNYLDATVEFQYKIYEFATTGASKPTTTTS